MKNVQLQAAYTWSHTISDVDLSDSSGNGYGTHTTSDPLNLGATTTRAPRAQSRRWAMTL